MYTKVEPFFLHSMTAVHAGSGSEVGLVDLPIQREQHTGHPKIEASSLKGAIRATAFGLQYNDEKKFQMTFGSEAKANREDETFSSAVGFSDARTLLFPVRSAKGVFAWVTSPGVLARFTDELLSFPQQLSEELEEQLNKLEIPEENTTSSKKLLHNGKLVLDQYTYEVQENNFASKWAEWLDEQLKTRKGKQVIDKLVILSDDNFTDFVKLSTEVNARIKIDYKTGIVDRGALWYEENLPAETVMYSLMFAGNVRAVDKQLLDDYQTAEDVVAFMKRDDVMPPVIQMGGNSTLARGMMKKMWLV